MQRYNYFLNISKLAIYENCEKILFQNEILLSAFRERENYFYSNEAWETNSKTEEG